MSKERRKFSAEFKARVALEALTGDSTLAELSSKYSVHPNRISQWKVQAKEGLVGIFADKRKNDSVTDSHPQNTFKPAYRKIFPRPF